ncbi:hypothetical protein G9A89_021177 [Geosiphon pyriformis]|nr:hypothetical protein G9A89_021177 [Geosiphon pyriformis]
MTIKVTGSAGSTCTLRVITVLYELNLPYELEVPNWADLKSEEYLKTKQPFGRIPVLNDDGFQIFESRAIVRYLAQKYQSAAGITLVPTDFHKLGLLEQFLSIEHSYFDTVFSPYVYETTFKKFKGLGEPDPAKVAEFQKKGDEVLDVYEKLLEGKDYLIGEYTIADLIHLPYFQFALNSGYKIGDRPNVQRWWKNISERPTWKKALAQIKH